MALRGDFSGLPATQVIYDPASQSCVSAVCTRTLFPGNAIPNHRISAIAQSLQSYLPTPTNSNIQNNHLPSLPVQLNTWNTTGKVDANLSDRHRLSGFFAAGRCATSFTGANSPGGWQRTNAHFYNEAANTFTAQDNVMWVKGRHSMVFGFQYQALQENENFALTASFTFNSVQTQGYNSTGSLLTATGNAYASYLLGAGSSSGVSQNSTGDTSGRYKDYALYVQDDWKVSSRLTLNLGLRWDLSGPFYEVNNLMSLAD